MMITMMKIVIIISRINQQAEGMRQASIASELNRNIFAKQAAQLQHFRLIIDLIKKNQYNRQLNIIDLILLRIHATII